MKKTALVLLLMTALIGPAGTAIAQVNGELASQQEGQAVPTPFSDTQQSPPLVPVGAGTDPTAHELYVTAYRVAQHAARGAEAPDAALRALQERITAKAAYIQQELQRTREPSR